MARPKGDVVRWARSAAVALTSCSLIGCPRTPPPSRFPTADAALERMHATYRCSRGARGESKVDYFGDDGRLRGNVLFLTMLPERLRFDVFSPFGVTLSTFTTDGDLFALYDLKNRQYLHGPPNPCNVARFTGLPVPAHVLAQLLRGEAPVLVHEPSAATIEWSRSSYLVRIASKHGASQTIRLVPRPEDWLAPWSEQRVRVKEVEVVQKGYRHWVAELGEHRSAKTAGPRGDPDDPLDPVIPPSGPACDAEIPRRILIDMPELGRDVIFRHEEVEHNPPVVSGTFRQIPPGGVAVRYAPCED